MNPTIAGCIAQKGITIKSLCAKIGMNHETWRRRRNNPDSLTLAEIRELDDALDMTEKDLVELIRGKK